MNPASPMANIRVLIVDDDAGTRSALKSLLESQGYSVDQAADGAAALERLVDLPPDLIVTDLDMPVMNGMQLLSALRERGQDVPVIVATSAAELSSAVEAMRSGATDYLTKPVDFDALLVALERAVEQRNIRLENENLRRQVREQNGEGIQGLLGMSPVMQKVYRLARQVAGSRATVLITGESGTGKGEFARAIHALGPRSHKPFVSVHCASLAENLLESELFGHEKGSFTGADRRRVGRFEQAHEGTLFLDEIGELPLPAQVKLLRVLQESEITRVGSSKTQKIDVRVIAATNKDLMEEVRQGRFREDLFHRLAVLMLKLPPLREREGDVGLLIDALWAKVNEECAEPGFAPKKLTPAAKNALLQHSWPGNIRELQNTLRRLAVWAQGPSISQHDIQDALLPLTRAEHPEPKVRSLAKGVDLQKILGETARRYLEAAITASHGNKRKAAQLLGLSAQTLINWAKKYDVRM